MAVSSLFCMSVITNHQSRLAHKLNEPNQPNKLNELNKLANR